MTDHSERFHPSGFRVVAFRQVTQLVCPDERCSWRAYFTSVSLGEMSTWAKDHLKEPIVEGGDSHDD